MLFTKKVAFLPLGTLGKHYPKHYMGRKPFTQEKQQKVQNAQESIGGPMSFTVRGRLQKYGWRQREQMTIHQGY